MIHLSNTEIIVFPRMEAHQVSVNMPTWQEMAASKMGGLWSKLHVGGGSKYNIPIPSIRGIPLIPKHLFCMSWNSKNKNQKYPALSWSFKVSFKGRVKGLQRKGPEKRNWKRKKRNVLRKKTFHLAPTLKRSGIKRKLVNLVSYTDNDAAGGFYSWWRCRMLASSRFGGTPLMSCALLPLQRWCQCWS